MSIRCEKCQGSTKLMENTTDEKTDAQSLETAATSNLAKRKIKVPAGGKARLGQVERQQSENIASPQQRMDLRKALRNVEIADVPKVQRPLSPNSAMRQLQANANKRER